MEVVLAQSDLTVWRKIPKTGNLASFFLENPQKGPKITSFSSTLKKTINFSLF